MTTVVNLRNDEYDVYIGRPSIFANPFKIGPDGGREMVIEKFKVYFLDKIEKDGNFRQAVLQLRGKRLGCFCYPLSCHGSVIAEWLDSHSDRNAGE